jgi:hypothetical protein
VTTVVHAYGRLVDPPGLPYESRVSQVLDDLAVCLCAQIEIDGLPPTCFCGVMPGAEVALDYAGDCEVRCGMAWVRMIAAYPSTSVGAAAERPGNCSAGVGIDIEMGIVRCLDVGDGGQPPSPDAMAGSARLQSADMMAMWRAVVCCNGSNDWMMGQYQPYGPEGALVGGMFQIAVTVF